MNKVFRRMTAQEQIMFKLVFLEDQEFSKLDTPIEGSNWVNLAEDRRIEETAFSLLTEEERQYLTTLKGSNRPAFFVAKDKAKEALKKQKMHEAKIAEGEKLYAEYSNIKAEAENEFKAIIDKYPEIYKHYHKEGLLRNFNPFRDRIDEVCQKYAEAEAWLSFYPREQDSIELYLKETARKNDSEISKDSLKELEPINDEMTKIRTEIENN